MSSTLLHAVPGLLSGTYPERSDSREGVVGKFRQNIENKNKVFKSSLGTYKNFAKEVAKLVAIYARLNDKELLKISYSLRHKYRNKGLARSLRIQLIALCNEAIYRQTGMRAYPNQIMAAAVMLEGRLAEMPTGEGKTLATIMASGAAAITGIPTHVMTANDYLVARDAEQAKQVFRRLNLTVGCVLTGQSPDVRREQYNCDVTYSTAKEVVFDYLKDLRTRKRSSQGLASRAEALSSAGRLESPLLRGLCFALVDEADSILLDEATTPLILSKPGKSPVSEADYRVAMRIAKLMDETLHYEASGNFRHIQLSVAGSQRIKDACASLNGLWNVSRFRESLVIQGITAWKAYQRDRDYMLRDGKVHIIDPTTGRIAEGRQWSNGLHQMIEIKEDCELSPQNETIAQITYQTFFPRYLNLGGTSATLNEADKELLEVYRLPVVRVPRNKISRFHNKGVRGFLTESSKWKAVVTSTQQAIDQGRPVLIGTDSIRASHQVSQFLQSADIEHVVLNAAQDQQEADIIATAGKAGRVTVTTNMAGRGTDIKLDERSRSHGGLHVISCQYNSSKRIDRQLLGRSARQGDPGVGETFVAMDDLMFQKYLPIRVQSALSMVFTEGQRLPAWLMTPMTRWVQFSSDFDQREQRSQLRKNDKQMRDWLALGGAGE